MNFFKKKWRGIKKLPSWIYLPPAVLLWLYRHSLRMKLVDSHECLAVDRFPFICVTWHNRLLFYALVFPGWARRRTYAVISASRDGQYLTDFISWFKVRCLRGSSSRRGGMVLLEGVKAIEDGCNVCFTPDGPRGPKYRMSRGPILLASKTGRPLAPVGINYSSYWQLNSWDNFQFPKPFCRVEVVIGEPLKIPPALDADGIEFWRLKAEDALKAVSVD